MRKELFFAVSVSVSVLLSAQEPKRPGLPASSGNEQVRLPPGAGQDWWSRVQETIRKDSYSVAWDEHPAVSDLRAAWRAPNRANGFESYFDEGGVRIARNEGDHPCWEWGLALVRWGREGSWQGVRPRTPLAKDNRVDLDGGTLRGWYINDERGLEQGFTILVPPVRVAQAPPPAGEKSTAEAAVPHEGHLHLDLALTGTLHPRISEDGRAVDFFLPGGNVSVLRYAELQVTDATGAILPSRFEGWCGLDSSSTLILHPSSSSGGIRISIDDTGAVYPITVDPLATSPAWTVLGENAGDSLGNSVATAGDVNGDGYSDVLVGASGFSSSTGKAYLFLGSASGLSGTAAWTAVGQNAGDRFGCVVATAGDVNRDGYSDVLVGAYGFSSIRGKAYLFLGGPSGLTGTPASPSWSANGEAVSNYFGFSLSTAGDANGDGYSDVVVGAYGYGTSAGRVYLYLGGASGLSSSASWTATGEAADNWYGFCVATAGDVNGDGYADVGVGAPARANGKAYLYLGGASGPAGTASWTANGESSYGFGYSISTAGDTDGDGYSDVVVGAPGYSSEAGKAYLYRGGASGLSNTASWTVVGEGVSYLGRSVAAAGDVNGDGYADVVVGASKYNLQVGAAYLFLGGASGLSSTASWTVTGASSFDYMGSSVATAGDVNGDGYSDVVVGANGFSAGGNTGKAFLYLGGPSGVSGTAAAAPWSALGESNPSQFGCSVAPAGDVNGDGYADVVVGAPLASSGYGKAYVFLGGASGLSSAASWSAAGENSNNSFGWCVASAGDVNGDGYSDVLVGAHGYQSYRGKAYLFLGGPSGLSGTSSWSTAGESTDNNFGYSLASAGDVNGDGYGDVVVGAWSCSLYRGRVYLFPGGPSGLPSVWSWSATGESPETTLGSSVASAGDVNGDGYSDLAVGAFGFNMGQGKAFVFLGGPSGLSSTPSWSKTGESGSTNFGSSVATAGDVNGDGYSDVLVGAPNASSYNGKAYLYLGGPAGLSSGASWWAFGGGPTGNNYFGDPVASAGDVNGDGYSDVVVGSYGYNGYQGMVYLFQGGPSGLSPAPAWTATGEAGNQSFAYSVAAAGDVNGDGFSDVIIGADGTSFPGKAYLFYGGGGPGVPARTQQFRSNLSAPIATLGLAYEKGFRIGLSLRSPAGRTQARIQWQTAPLGGTFLPWLNPIQTYGTAYSAVGPGTLRTIPVALADEAVPYVWRARLKYSAVGSPFLPYSPWFTPAANGSYEKDLMSTSQDLPPLCVVPDEPCWLYSVTKTGTNYTLNWQDPNQPDQRTGWNIRRSNNASLLPKTAWPLVGSNVVDMDAGAANYQWTDHSGDDPTPSTVWYYEVTTLNLNCPSEGPF